MRRAIQKTIEDPLSDEILSGRFKKISKIRLELVDGEPMFVESEVEALASVG